MKSILIKLALAAAAPLALGACANGYTGFDVGLGYGGGGYGYGGYGGYGYPGYYPAYGYGWDPYDVWYDGFYGPYSNGYWATDGFFWYQGGDHRWHRGDHDHFHHGGDHDGDWHHGDHNGGSWQHYSGQPLPGWGGNRRTPSGTVSGTRTRTPTTTTTTTTTTRSHSSSARTSSGTRTSGGWSGWGGNRRR